MKNIRKNEKRFNVLFVVPFIYSLFKKNEKIPFGGAEVQLFLLIKELIKRNSPNLKISIITGKPNLEGTYFERHKNLELIISQNLSQNFLNFFKRPLILLFNLIRSSPDVIIQRVGGIETGISSLYAMIFKKAFIYSIAHERDLKKRGRKGLLRLFYNFGLHIADFIIAQSEQQKEILKRWSKQKEQKTIVIKSGYEIKNPSVTEKKGVLWVGRGRRWKRGEIFINLAKDFPETDFKMICNKREGYDEYWNQLKSESTKVPNLQFIERVPFSEIDVYFKKAKIFVNTSIKEGFPNTFIQSLKNKTPILSLNVDPDNLLERYRCGFYCNNDVNKLKSHLKELLENKSLYKEYSQNAYDYVKTHHDIKKTSKKWKKLLWIIKEFS